MVLLLADLSAAAVQDGPAAGDHVDVQAHHGLAALLIQADIGIGHVAASEEQYIPLGNLNAHGVLPLGRGGGGVSQKEYHAPSPAVLARVVLAPELTHRGSVLLYLVVTLFAALNIFQICFPGFFFRLSLLGLVRNREDAEPSDFYIGMEHIEWAVLAIVCLVLYNMCLNSVWT